MFRPVVLFRCTALHLALGSALALLPAASPAAMTGSTLPRLTRMTGSHFLISSNVMPAFSKAVHNGGIVNGIDSCSL